MAACSRCRRHPSSTLGLAGVLLLGLATLVRSDNFHYGHISWKQCIDTPGGGFGFEDVLFPGVCTTSTGNQGRKGLNARSFGFTIEGAWPVENTAQSMLTNPTAEIGNWISKACYDIPPLGQRGCTLTVGQGMLDSNKRVVGYKRGRGQQAYVPNVGPLVNTEGELVADGGYKFIITGMDADLKYVFARYSFQLDFVADGDYTVYFEGCCRPGELRNNANLVYHIRSEVRVLLLFFLPYCPRKIS